MRWPSDPPRRHHYEFAHRVLPRLAFQPDVDLAAMAAAGLLDDALLAAWAEVGKGLPTPQRLTPDGLRGELADIGGIAAVIMTMPPATRTTEAHLAAVAPASPPEDRRYLVLEHSWTATGEPATVLGEWLRDQSHLNLGAGPGPSTDAFARALHGLQASGPPADSPE